MSLTNGQVFCSADTRIPMMMIMIINNEALHLFFLYSFVSSCLNRAFIWASECTGSPYWLFIITLTFGLWVNLLNRVSLGNNLSKDSAKTMRSQIKTFKAWSPLNKQCENSITLFFCRSLQNSIRCYKRDFTPTDSVVI